YLTRNRTELARRGIRHDHHLVLVQIAVHLQDGRLGELTPCQNARRPIYRTAHRELQLHGAVPREILGVLQKTDVMHADDHRHGTRQRSRVLDVQQIGTILPAPHRQVEAQAEKRVGSYTAGPNIRGKALRGVLLGHVGDQLVAPDLGSKSVQKTPNVDLVTR